MWFWLARREFIPAIGVITRFYCIFSKTATVLPRFDIIPNPNTIAIGHSMRTSVPLLLAATFLTVGACADTTNSHSSRSAASPFAFAEQGSRTDVQARALSDMSRRIVVQTTLKGAGIGAAVGCGLVVVSAGNAKNCIAGAATGALGGAVIGRAVGKKKVAREIAAIAPSAVVRTLRKTNEQMALVETSLPARLAAQDEALSLLEVRRATGQMDAESYAKGRASIIRERQAIANALIQTQSNATQAASNLRAAKSKGQSGLDWHIGAADRLANQASSARAAISLL